MLSTYSSRLAIRRTPSLSFLNDVDGYLVHSSWLQHFVEMRLDVSLTGLLLLIRKLTA